VIIVKGHRVEGVVEPRGSRHRSKITYGDEDQLGLRGVCVGL
jgi:hypothetical protein